MSCSSEIKVSDMDDQRLARELDSMWLRMSEGSPSTLNLDAPLGFLTASAYAEDTFKTLACSSHNVQCDKPEYAAISQYRIACWLGIP